MNYSISLHIPNYVKVPLYKTQQIPINDMLLMENAYQNQL